MALPTVPPPIDVPSEQRKAIIAGVKQVMEIFQANNLLGASVTYQDLIHDPAILYEFIQNFRANRGLADAIVVDSAGVPPLDEETPLTCGVTLAQIQQLLVKTCAKYYFEQDARNEAAAAPAPAAAKRGFLGLRRSSQPERKSGGPQDDRKARELLANMAFDWQLPLLTDYLGMPMSYIMELGPNILALRSPEALEAVQRIGLDTLRKVKGIVRGDLGDLLTSNPAAIGGITEWPADMYPVFRQAMGPRVFDFYARDRTFFMVCAQINRSAFKIYGDVLAYISQPSLEELQRLSIDKTDALIQSLRAALEDKLEPVLVQPSFSRDVLRRLVESVMHLDYDKEQLLVSAGLTCKAIAPQILEWLAKQQAKQAPAAAGS